MIINSLNCPKVRPIAQKCTADTSFFSLYKIFKTLWIYINESYLFHLEKGTWKIANYQHRGIHWGLFVSGCPMWLGLGHIKRNGSHLVQNENISSELKHSPFPFTQLGRILQAKVGIRARGGATFGSCDFWQLTRCSPTCTHTSFPDAKASSGGRSVGGPRRRELLRT